MVLKKLDNRLRVLIENGVQLGHRSLFVVVGDKGRDQVVILHHILSKAQFKARPSVLWCYKKELGFSSNRKKRMRDLQKKIRSGRLNVKEDDPFELFVASTQIRYCYYAETHKILGNTFGMCVLQDFEALTPNLLARTIETVEGGGIVVILLRAMSSLKQLCTLAMDVHSRYRTEAHQDVVARFNERFLLSLSSCSACLVVDDNLNILPVSSQVASIKPVPPKSNDDLSPNDQELKELRESLKDTQPLGVLVGCCKTLDQAKSVLKFIDVITQKTLRSTVSLTAARGRGKSAALGIAISGAIAFGYSNIFVTSPSAENLKTLFEFVVKGFEALKYQEHMDYDILQSTNPDFNKAVIRINVFRDHRQTVQYIVPSDAAKLSQAELLVIDEAAAIPLPLVRSLLGPYLVFISSTVNGYEGTGRSLSLKLLQQLREQSATFTSSSTTSSQPSGKMVSATGRTLVEMTLDESIRYKPDDQVESWLYRLLCLDISNLPKITTGCPSPADCELYYVNRDTLFSYHKATEKFLQRLMAIYVAAHYKNTPNDLQMISDAPAHQLFCLFGPQAESQQSKGDLPEIFCVLQIDLEGEISKQNVVSSMARGHRAAGDLIPWTLAQQFQDSDFPSLSGARVVRIATHPEFQGMGYGTRAIQQLEQYYAGLITSLNEDTPQITETVDLIDVQGEGLLEEQVTPRRALPPLFLRLTERKPEKLDYLGVSYGLTGGLLKFWKRAGFVPCYLRQTPNDLTGEHSCIMLKLLHADQLKDEKENWLLAYFQDFRHRLVNLFSYQFSNFTPSLALSLLQQKQWKEPNDELSRNELSLHLTNFDLRRLELYSQNLVDYHLITDLLPTISRLYFLNRINVHLSAAQMAILLGLGLQHKTVEDSAKDLDLPVNQILALFNRGIRKILQYFNGICEQAVEKTLNGGKDTKIVMEATGISLEDDLKDAAEKFDSEQKSKAEAVKSLDLNQYSIRGSEDDWSNALKDNPKPGGILSVKSAEKAANKREMKIPDEPGSGKKKKLKRLKNRD